MNVTGLAAAVAITGHEATDRLDVNTLAGTDTVNSGGLAAGVIGLFVDGVLVARGFDEEARGPPPAGRGPREPASWPVGARVPTALPTYVQSVHADRGGGRREAGKITEPAIST